MKLITEPEALRLAVESLDGNEVVFIDTEFDASREGTLLCLIQISAGEEVFLVDPLALPDLAPLGECLGRENRTWVLHAAQQDIPLLVSRLGVNPARVFDTQVAWALVSVEHSTSLAYLKYRLLGLRAEKAHQADDWRRRPLPARQLAYAADDVAHLPALYRGLAAKTAELGRLAAVYEASAETFLPQPESTAPFGMEAFRNAWQLEPEGQAVLRYLIEWYNGLTEEQRAAAPDSKGLFSLASRRPSSLQDLSALRAVSRRTVHTHGKALVAGIQRALARMQRDDFVPIEPPPYATKSDILASGWLEAARAEVCTELEIAPELALPARLVRRMRDLAVVNGQLSHALEALTGWRKELLFAPLAERLSRHGPLRGA